MKTTARFWKYIPNSLTVLRLIIVPFVGYFIYTDDYFTAVILFAAGAATDFLDGKIARKFNVITQWGKVLDPIADKLLQFSSIAMLFYKGIIPVIVPLIIFIKEILLGIGALLIFKKSNKVHGAYWYGKFATTVLYGSVIIIILVRVFASDENFISAVTAVFVTITVLAALFAFVMYLRLFVNLKRDIPLKKG